MPKRNSRTCRYSTILRARNSANKPRIAAWTNYILKQLFCTLVLALLTQLTLPAQLARASDDTQAMRLALALKAPIEQGLLEVEAVDRYIVIRMTEKDAFAAEAATLRPAYLSVVATIRVALKTIEGNITVAGYTDDVLISTPKYRSNWEFAAARASAVLTELLKTAELKPDRFTLASYGATRPLVANDNAENRARNCRVEIVIQQ